MRFGWYYVVGGAMGLLITVSSATTARGGAIDVPMQSAKAAGMADAFTAQADDPSAIFYNPAGLTQLKGTNFSGGIYLLQADWGFEGDAGTNETMSLLTLLPHLYAESDFGTKNWRFGIGVTNVFGLNEDWGDDGALRFIVDEAQLSVLNIAPTVAYKFGDHFSLGMAFNAYYGSLKLKRNMVLGAPPTPEGKFDYEGDDFAFGVTPGLLWKINDRHSIGAYYRSPFKLDFDGDAEVKMSGNPVVGPSDAEAALEFPQSIGIGYAFKPIKPWTVEADVVWTDWESVNELKFSSSNPAFDGQAIPAEWNSGFTYRLGTNYQINDKWAVRAGYAYSQSAIPNATYSPIVPDADYHLFSLGVGYATPRWGIDVSGQYIHREDRHVSGSVNSPTVDGDWTNDFVGLMATLSFKL